MIEKPIRSCPALRLWKKSISRKTGELLRSPQLNGHIHQKISPAPSFPKRGTPPFCKGREGEI
jgi:hypothetical protein